MAVWHVKAGGTRVVGDGASTPGDWSDANCFDDDSNLNEWWRILRDHMADGDELIFYDENDGSTLVRHNVEAIVSMVNHTTPGTFTIKSRSGDRRQCRLKAKQGDMPLMNCSTNTAGINYIFEGLSFEEPENYNYAGAMLFNIKNAMGDVTFHNCGIGNVTLNVTSAEQLGGLISSESGTTRTITFSGDDSAIENITSTDTWYGGSYIGQFAAGTTVRITGTLTVQNITLTPVNNIRGGMFGYADLEIVGDVIDRNRSIAVNDGKFNRALFILSGNVSVPGSIDSADIQAIGGTSGCAVLHMTGAFNVNNVTGNRITVQQQAGQNSVGTLVLALGSAASGYVRRVEGNDLTGFSGGCVYFSGGASGLVESVIARRNRMGENGAGAYSGGDGDMTIISLYAIDCHAEKLGGAFFAHNHPTSSTRNKTVKVINLTAINCTAANGGNAVYINSPNETYTMTSSIENAVIRGQATDNVAFGESGASVHTATIDNSDIEGGASAITDGTTNGSVTATNIFDDGSQVNADGTLVPDSPYRTAGNYRRYGTRDANGRLFGLPMPIGALGPGSNPANTRTARA